ncbi:OprO/OprP family phosphate-selective porin [Flavobacterium agricola]|uniref:OprO/OprP family phosphate-selective porin n=1 Tax=Flavobacterium agricola TaxID=2870839 RepID=A0ABY6M4A6_9FLAO|nr:OprO/OprP family phosphate-selective porin [Flavobacterium agricola]UYW02428.1 OprO/OprP family phosphate-selective porin [Flavobacterium agricola]
MKKIFILFILFCSAIAFGQVKFDKNNSLRLESLPYYSYGKGLGITSADSIFQLNIRFRMQNRVTYYEYENPDEKPVIEGMIRRLRLRFDGYVGDPRFLYAIQLSFAANDVGTIEEGENVNIIRDAMIFYRPNQNWTFGLGQTKLPGNRQRVNSSGALQLTDRSINNAKFNIDRDFGFQTNYNKMEYDKFSYAVRGAISSGEGRNWTKTNDTGLAYTGKVEFFPLGAFKNDGTNFEGAIVYENKPKIYLSAVYHKNNQAVRSSGQYGAELFQPRNLQNIFGDFVFKYQNWAVMVAYMNRTTTNSSYVTHNPLDPSQISFVFGGQGMDYQASYTFANHFELIGRYSWQNVNKQIAQYEPDAKQYTIGLTKYIWEHAFKLQGEVSYNQRDYMVPKKGDDWYVRFQIEIGI